MYNERIARILLRLLAVDFPGSHALQAQAAVAHFSPLVPGDAGDPSLSIEVGAATLADVDNRIPVEGTAVDSDGMLMHFLVHVVDGKLNELEVYRLDLGPVLQLPEPDHVRTEVNRR